MPDTSEQGAPVVSPTAPRSKDNELEKLIYSKYKIRFPKAKVCANHSPPWEYLREMYFKRPPLTLVLGPRGGGKSFISALYTHLSSQFRPGLETRILGGSKGQSAQVYRALQELVWGKPWMGVAPDRGCIDKMHQDRATYRN